MCVTALISALKHCLGEVPWPKITNLQEKLFHLTAYAL